MTVDVDVCDACSGCIFHQFSHLLGDMSFDIMSCIYKQTFVQCVWMVACCMQVVLSCILT